MTFEKAMKKADRGVKVRHPGMNERWGIVTMGDQWIQISTTGAHFVYFASVADRERRDWCVMKSEHATLSL